MKTPAVSVVIPVRNYEGYIAAAIESVRAQTFLDWELIVVDDASTDGTAAVVDRYQDGERIRLVRNASRMGQFPTHNRGAEFARGKYLKFFHGDDVMYPLCLEIMAGLMEAHPAAGLGISHDPWPWIAPKLFSPGEAWHVHVARQTRMFSEGPSGTIFKREAFEGAGRFDERIGVTEDTEMNLRTAMTYPVLLLPSGLWWYRVHAEQEAKSVSRRLQTEESRQWYEQLLRGGRNPLPRNLLDLEKRRAVSSLLRLVLRRIGEGRPGQAWRLWRTSGLPASELWGILKSEGAVAPRSEIEQPAWGAFLRHETAGASHGGRSAPRVSIVIAARNCEADLGRSVESVIAQRFRDWELIIIDDASTDRTAEQASEICTRLAGTFLKHETALGTWASFNAGARAARGGLVKFLEPGDLLYPHCLETMLGWMERYPEAGLGISGTCGPYRPGVCLDPRTAWRSEIFGTPRFLEGPSALIVRKDLFLAAGGFNQERNPPERHLQLTMAQASPVVLINDGLHYSPLHPGSVFRGQYLWPLGWGEGYPWLLAWVASAETPLAPEERRDALVRIIRYLWRRGDRFVPQAHRPRGLGPGERVDLLRWVVRERLSFRDLVRGFDFDRPWSVEMNRHSTMVNDALPEWLMTGGAQACLMQGRGA